MSCCTVRARARVRWVSHSLTLSFSLSRSLSHSLRSSSSSYTRRGQPRRPADRTTTTRVGRSPPARSVALLSRLGARAKNRWLPSTLVTTIVTNKQNYERVPRRPPRDDFELAPPLAAAAHGMRLCNTTAFGFGTVGFRAKVNRRRSRYTRSLSSIVLLRHSVRLGLKPHSVLRSRTRIGSSTCLSLPYNGFVMFID